MTKYDKMKLLAPTVLRIGIALVFLWFGFQQILHTGAWVSMIPKSIIDISGLSATTLVHLNGAFEIVFGISYYGKLSSIL